MTTEPIPAPPDEIELVYGYLVSRYADARRKNDVGRAEDIYHAIHTIECEFPEETQRWKDRTTGKAEANRV